MTPYVINPPASPNPKLPLIFPSPYSSHYDQPNSPHGNSYHALRFPFSRNRPSALHPPLPSREHDPLPERLYTTRRDASQPPYPIGQNPDRPRGTTRTPTVSTATDSFNTQLERHSSNQRRTVGDRQPPSPTTRHIQGHTRAETPAHHRPSEPSDTTTTSPINSALTYTSDELTQQHHHPQ